MNFEIYCDESGVEALFDKQAHQYAAIGGIWIPAEHRDSLKTSLKAIKSNFNIHGEFKWNKVSPAYFDFYKSLIDFFFQTDYVRFRIILLEASKVDNYKFHKGDSELGFYKFYYQLLHHWIFDFNTYDIFLDFKINRNKGRLKELNRVLNNSNLTSNIRQVQGLPSEENLGIQLADLLTGVVAAKFNEKITSPAKTALIAHIEETYLKSEIRKTNRGTDKFNVFLIDLKGGW